MAGSLTVPIILANLGGGNQNLATVDADFAAITSYINAREITIGPAASRPAAGVSGRYYFASDAQGGTLSEDTGSGWQQLAPGLTQVIGGAAPQVLVGLTLSNDGTTPNTVLDVAAGACNSDDATITDRILMTLGTAFTGTTGGTWVVGSGQPKLDVGAIAAATWYHVFLIERTDTNVVDILFSLSPTAPTLPTSYTKQRRLGSFQTDGSANILAFVQDGDRFQWTVLRGQEVNSLNPGTSAVTRTLSVPTGVHVVWLGQAGVVNAGALGWAYFSDLATDDTGANGIGQLFYQAGVASAGAAVPLQIRTNTSAQIRSRLSFSDGTTQLVMSTYGWLDRRGQDS